MKKLVCLTVMLTMLAACATDPYSGESKVSKTAWGAGIGTAIGAGIGALAGGEKGALIGAGIGAAAGAGTAVGAGTGKGKSESRITIKQRNGESDLAVFSFAEIFFGSVHC